jgi:hypothetical protein
MIEINFKKRLYITNNKKRYKNTYTLPDIKKKKKK